MLPGLFLARKKDRSLYPEDLLGKWGFNLAVQAVGGDAFEKEAHGVKCLVYNTSGDFSILALRLTAEHTDLWCKQ